ncbi:MAG TPA: hypothetical protein VEA78_08865, partial [Acidimicrobiales bacterium]|nr:hypothetical protein [Acidimicrobiales bacterium]
MTELDLSAVRWFQSIYVDVRLPYRTTLKLDPPSWTTPLPSTDVEVLEGSARMGEPAVEGKIVISLCWSPIPRFEARIVVDVPEDFEPWEVGTELLVRAEHGIYGLDLVVRIDSVAVQQLLFGGIGVSVVGEVRSEFIGELPRDERITSLRLTFANAFLPLGDEAEIELDRIGQPGPKYTCRTASSAFLVDGVAVTVEALAPWNALEYFALVEASESGDPLPFQPDALWLHNRLPTNGYVASLAVELRPTGRGFSRAEVKKWTQATELLLTMATATSCTGIHMEARDARGGVHTQWRLPRSLPAEPLQSWWPRGGATSNEIAASLTTLRAVVDAEYSMTWMPLVASWYVAAVAARDPRSRLIQTQAASELLAWVHLVVERNM